LSEGAERRRNERCDANWPITAYTENGVITGETINISIDGISLSCDEPLPMDEVLDLAILAPDERIIKVDGKVTWADLCGIDEQDKAVGMGLCFIELSDEDRDYLTEMIASLSE